MIVDTTRITLGDGTVKPAIDLYPNADVLTVRNQKPRHAVVVEKMIRNQDDIICLVLSNGGKLVGTRDQRVCVHRNKNIWFTEMANVEVGMYLRGIEAGAFTAVRVIGIMFFARHPTRLVEFRFAQNDCFVAEGVLCR